MKTINEVKNYVLNSDDYSFLKTEDKLKDKLLLLTMGGSISYGTERRDDDGNILSDIDVRGIAMPSKEDLFSYNCYEVFEHRDTDTVIYEFRKLIKLITECNPNTIEMLGSSDRNTIYCNNIGKRIIENSNLFLSNVASKSFCGYASAQLDRLTNALARDAYTQSELEQHILNSIDRQMMSFDRAYRNFENGSIKLYIDKSDSNDMDTEIYMDCDLKHYPLRDYKGMWMEMHNVVKTYGKENHRNRKKDELHLNKHSMHIIRLYLMGIDLFETGKIITYRENDLELLTAIRNGKYLTEDGSYSKEFFDLVDDLKYKFNEAIKHSVLQDKPDMNKINKFIADCVEEYYYS